jgi:hypothetical protein
MDFSLASVSYAARALRYKKTLLGVIFGGHKSHRTLVSTPRTLRLDDTCGSMNFHVVLRHGQGIRAHAVNTSAYARLIFCKSKN